MDFQLGSLNVSHPGQLGTLPNDLQQAVPCDLGALVEWKENYDDDLSSIFIGKMFYRVMVSPSHMGQIPQDGENGCFVSFFLFFLKLYCD